MHSRAKLTRIFCLTAAAFLLGAVVTVTAAAQRVRAEMPDGLYLLCLEGDTVAVRQENGSFVLTEIAAGSLREEDRRRLANGIQAETPEELMQLLEDLGS